MLEIRRTRGDAYHELVSEFSKMKQAGIPPNAETYLIMLKPLASKKAHDTANKAFALLQEMKDTGVQPTPVIYYTILTACVGSAPFNVDRMVQIYHEMRTLRVPLDEQVYKNLILASEEQKRPDLTATFMKDMKDVVRLDPVQSAKVAMARVSQALLERKFLEGMKQLETHWETAGLHYNSCNVLLFGLYQRGKLFVPKHLQNDWVHLKHGMGSLQGSVSHTDRAQFQEFYSKLKNYFLDNPERQFAPVPPAEYTEAVVNSLLTRTPKKTTK